MPDSVKINPLFIKHLRKREKMSQVALAAAIGITDRGVQKIEASGKTSSETAEKLALYFGFSVNDLMEGNIPCKAEYWAKDPVTGEHLIFSYAHTVLEKLKFSWADYCRFFCSDEKKIINVEISKGYYCLTSSCEEAGFDWKFEYRRVWFNEDIGLCWTPESEFESQLMQEKLFQIVIEEADDVFVNGDLRYTDEGDYQVTVSSWDFSNNKIRKEAVCDFQTLSCAKSQLETLLLKFVPKEIKDASKYLAISGGAIYSGVCIEAWPKISPRSLTFEGVVEPVRIHVIRKNTSVAPSIPSTWSKRSKTQFVTKLLERIESEAGSEIDNSRAIEWETELKS